MQVFSVEVNRVFDPIKGELRIILQLQSST